MEPEPLGFVTRLLQLLGLRKQPATRYRGSLASTSEAFGLERAVTLDLPENEERD